MSEANHYSTLGIHRQASQDDVRAAYRRMAMKWHPDRHLDHAHKTKAEAVFKLVQQAYDTLGEPSRRARYDATFSARSQSADGESNQRDDEALARFAKFKAGAALGRSRNPAVVTELRSALELVRTKIRVGINSCRYHVSPWFGKQAAEEFMTDVRLHGLNVFCEQADFVITWIGRY